MARLFAEYFQAGKELFPFYSKHVGLKVKPVGTNYNCTGCKCGTFLTLFTCLKN